MKTRYRRIGFVCLGLLLLSSVVTACAFSVTGGAVGGLISLLLGVVLVGVGVSSSGCEVDTSEDTAQGATDVPDAGVGVCLTAYFDVGPCLGALPEDVVGPCLQPPLPDVGPCLSRPLDIGVCLQPPPDVIFPCLDPPPDDVIGPCLEPPLPDVVGPCLDYDPDVFGPCLSPPPPDLMGPCLSYDPDAFGPCLSIIPPPADATDDAEPIGPCLSMRESKLELPARPVLPAGPPTTLARAAVTEKVLARGGLPEDVAARLRETAPGEPDES